MSEPTATSASFPHVVRLPVLGVETTFATNASEVLELVKEAWGRWEALRGVPDLVSSSDAVVRIMVGSRRSGTDVHAPADDRSDRPRAPSAPPDAEVGSWPRAWVTNAHTMRVDGAGGSGVADSRRLESLAHVTPELVSRRDEFVEGWLEPLTLFLLGALDRQPLHAAAVLGSPQFPGTEHEAAGAKPTALLLAGPSGAGKSTLTYAAWRSGRFAVLADEPVYVQLEPRVRVWGRRARIHLSVDARAWFPELHGVAPARLPTGKTKIVVDAAGEPSPYAERAGLCLLARGSGDRPRLEPVTVERAVAELTAILDPGYDLFRDTIGERVARVAEGGAWRLCLTDDPGAALPLLEEAVAMVRGAA